MAMTKVFGIGFQKTATTSFGAALTHLGYRVTGPDWVTDPDIAVKVRDLSFQAVDHFDGFQDNPWPILYRQLDERCPGSKFVLTTRETDRWIASLARHFGPRETPMRKWIYGHGSVLGHEQVYIERFERHNTEVLDYFRDRPNDLLVMDITKGHGWEQLCPFLGHAIPDLPFPHRNEAGWREWAALKETLKRRLGWLRRK